MGAVEKQLQLKGFNFLEEFFQVAAKVRLDLRLGGGRLGFTQLDHHAAVIERFFEAQDGFDFAADARGFVDGNLGFFAIVPEIFVGHEGRQFTQPFLQVGKVKETSASR